jgi:cytoskeleton protein RodZ
MNALPLTDAGDEFAPSRESADGPGRRLRDARQARGLELARVADQLHLKPTLIAALEQDDYDALPGSVFIIGYLRNYARMLGLDPEPLLAAYRHRQPQAEPPPPRAATAGRRRAGGGHLAVRLFSLAVILTLLGLSYAWWQDYRPALYPEGARHESASGDLDLGPAAESTAGAPLMDVDAPAAPADAAAFYQPPIETAPEASPRATGLAEDEVAEAPGELLAPASSSTLVTAEPRPSAAPALPPETTALYTEPVPADPAAEEPVPEPSAEEPATPSEGVVMEFSGPCWVDIRDSERRFKLFGEMKDGDRHVLAGTPPYSVIIGNAAAVRISVNGKPFELEGIARGNVARFTLDPERLP